MLKVVIVDDEIPSQETLESLLEEYCVEVKIVGTADNVEDAISCIEGLKPHLVFLDIELQSGTGFDILSRLKHQDFLVVFTTAFEHYALKAIKYAAMDYLLKPIDIKELQQAVHKAHQQLSFGHYELQREKLLSNLSMPEEDQTLALKLSDSFKFIHISEICYCQADGPYTNIKLTSGQTVVQSKNLKEFEELLGEMGFIRIHHSYLVNRKEIDRLTKGKNAFVEMKDGTQISVSSRKREEFFKIMNLG